jgi:hypothetical protein
MAVKYYAEIVRATPATKNVCGEQVIYNVRVFKGDTVDPTIEDQLNNFQKFETGTSSQRRATVGVKAVTDLVLGQVLTVHNDPFWVPLDNDYFSVGFTSSKPSTYTPKFMIKIYQPFQSILPGLSNASTSSLVASTEQADLNNGALPVTIIPPRQTSPKNWGQIGYNPAKWQTVAVPSITFTKAAVAPDRASTLAQASPQTLNGWGWDSCNKRWVGIFSTYKYKERKSPYRELPAVSTDPIKSTTYEKQVKYSVKSILESDLKKYPTVSFEDHATAGRVKTVWTASGWDWMSDNKAYVPPSATVKITSGSYKNEAIASHKKFQSSICEGATSSTTTTTTTTTTPPATSTTIKSAEAFNPPPHIMTRHFSPIAFGGKDSYDDGNSYNQLGMIYMDPDTVLNTAKVYDKKVTKFWGFRFIFNPTTFSYSMNSSNNVDWTRKNPNNAVLVADGVGGVITMRLIIDRVADMNTMRRWDLNGRQGIVGAPDYPTTLTPEQCAGILNRGTEYDLEYMFRVFNGNPELSTLLGNSKQDLEMATANLGYMTALPFVLKLNDQLRYKVNVTGITVLHDLFTKEMIPIRTAVDFTCQRLPEFYSENKKYLTIDTQTQLIKTLPTTAVPLGGRGGTRGAVIE